MGGDRIRHVQVEVHLLGRPIRPVWWSVVRGQLHADAPQSFAVDHAVEAVILEDVPVEHTGPEGALRMKVSSIEDDDATHDVHAR